MSLATPGDDTGTRRPFTRADAVAAGLDVAQLRGSRFRRVFRGVYVGVQVPDSPRLRAEAALLLFDSSAWASHASAARLLRVPIPTVPDEHVSVPRPELRRRRLGVVCHLQRRPQVQLVDGVRVSGAGQLFVELASMLALVDLVVVGDNLVRSGRITPARLVSHCAASRDAGAARARRAAGYVRDRVDSPMETRLRMLIVLAGLPEPRVNLAVRGPDGEMLRRHDLCWPEARLIVEYDGRDHAERLERWEADLGRREDVDREGWRILVVVASGIYRQPGATVLRIWRALRERGAPGVPARPREGWRAHFPGRD